MMMMKATMTVFLVAAVGAFAAGLYTLRTGKDPTEAVQPVIDLLPKGRLKSETADSGPPEGSKPVSTDAEEGQAPPRARQAQSGAGQRFSAKVRSLWEGPEEGSKETTATK